MTDEQHRVTGAVFANAIILKSVADVYASIGLDIAAAHVTAAIDAAYKSVGIDPELLGGEVQLMPEQVPWSNWVTQQSR
jgi:hypothetical protein